VRRAKWIQGNAVRLLENGEEFFPRVFQAIAEATGLVLLETFILQEDKVGIALGDALCACAARGATTVLTVDGFGSPDLSDPFIARLTDAGVRVRIFDPGRPCWASNSTCCAGCTASCSSWTTGWPSWAASISRPTT
jgi:cardiolipin synthase